VGAMDGGSGSVGLDGGCCLRKGPKQDHRGSLRLTIVV
jgi:hypothetical protein